MTVTFHATQKDFLVTVSGIDGTFATCTGGEPEGQTGVSWDGGSDNPVVTSGRPTWPALVVSRPYSPERDGPVEARLQRLVGKGGKAARFTVSRTATDADGVVSSEPKVWPDALLTKVRGPEADADSGTTARLELTFMPHQIA